jgi:hypothetical protein
MSFLPFQEEFGPLQRDLAVVHSLSLVEAFRRRSPEVSGSSVMLRFHGNHPGYNSSFPDHVLGLGEQSFYFRVLTARAAQLDTLQKMGFSRMRDIHGTVHVQIFNRPFSDVK